jgi:uncharacterized protein (TIGR02246 family)
MRRIAKRSLALVLAVACARASSTDRGAAVVAAMDHYAALVRAVNSDSVAAMFTQDAQLLEPGMAPLRGREAIRAFLAPFDGKVTVDTVENRTDLVEVYGDTAYLWGRYRQVARTGDQPPGEFDGRYVARWRLEADGRWRLARLLMQPAPKP